MSINKVILIGNLCHDPSIKTFESGQKVAEISLATSKKGYTSSAGKQVPEQTEYHNLVIWGKLSEIAEKYIKKGDKLYVEGELRTRSYDDKNGGAKRYVTEIFVNSIEMLSPKKQENSVSENSNTYTAPSININPPESDLPF